MRYFLVSYAHPNGFGNLCISGSNFPAQEFIRNQVASETGTIQVIVVNIFEFRNERDYLAFQGIEIR
jgi:hypothetical protein